MSANLSGSVSLLEYFRFGRETRVMGQINDNLDSYLMLY